MTTKEEIYQYRIEKGWVQFPQVKQAILQAMDDYAKVYHRQEICEHEQEWVRGITVRCPKCGKIGIIS